MVIAVVIGVATSERGERCFTQLNRVLGRLGLRGLLFLL